MSGTGIIGGLFLSAFLAATLLPAQSEAVLTMLLLSGQHAPWLLLAVASVGNILGSSVNWMLGRGIERFREKRWFPASPGQLQKAKDWYARYGKWSLLLSWVPVIGDPLTLAAGIMRERFVVFLILVSVAKTGRYVVLYLIIRSAAG